MQDFKRNTFIPNRINPLGNRLANQIAAGEVVERPASVVKELLENAIDSGASKIELVVERGGTRLIQVTDDGSGIVKEDLALALARHATSKIASSDDLASIKSLGFRGEALASISSVSRLCLTSRTHDSEMAWQAIAEGREMQVEILPAAATAGTRIEVSDLFYNTPARQKFLKAEKTEFSHIEEVFKRHALANPDIAFILKHNGKIVKRVPAIANANQQFKRLEAICGSPFSTRAKEFSCQHEYLEIQGWLGGCDFHRSESDLQYVFINGRPVKDRMINHAIRQAHTNLLPHGRMATYVVFLAINVAKVDVNVHPTKHEVRFDDQRLVHDLIVKSVSEGLEQFSPDFETISFDQATDSENSPLLQYASQQSGQPGFEANKGVASIKGGYSNNNFGEKFNQINTINTQFSNEPLNSLAIKLDDKYWLAIQSDAAYLINGRKLFQYYLETLFNEGFRGEIDVERKPLLFPQYIKISREIFEQQDNLRLIENLGFRFEPSGKEGITLHQIPIWLVEVEVADILASFNHWIGSIIDDQQTGIVEIGRVFGYFSKRTIDHLVKRSDLGNLNAGSSKITIADLTSLTDKLINR